MDREIYQQNVLAERIISKRNVKLDGGQERLEYMIKWKGLPYSEATWEEASLCTTRFDKRIQEFNFREQNQNKPSANNPFSKRPKFKKQEKFSCIPEDLSLRDYQRDGVNWLMHAWSKVNTLVKTEHVSYRYFRAILVSSPMKWVLEKPFKQSLLSTTYL